MKRYKIRYREYYKDSCASYDGVAYLIDGSYYLVINKIYLKRIEHVLEAREI